MTDHLETDFCVGHDSKSDFSEAQEEKSRSEHAVAVSRNNREIKSGISA
jgi:hypothetical protein